LQAFVQEYAGTEAALLGEVDVITNGPTIIFSIAAQPCRTATVLRTPRREFPYMRSAMKRTGSLVIVFVAALFLAAPPIAGAQGRGNGRGHAAKADKPAKAEQPAKKAHVDEKKAAKDVAKRGRKDDVDVVVVDRDGHARVIREYRGTGSLPPGLAKRRELPPGLRRQVIERGALPPGLRGYLVEVPGPWTVRLPALPAYYHRYFAGDDLVVVDTRTNRIVAVVRDVLR
jgi:hypothetical protein